MLDEMLDEFCYVCTFFSSINHLTFTNSIYNRKLKMKAEQTLMLVMLPELMDSDDEKPTRGKTRSC